MPALSLHAAIQSRKLRKPFVISTGARTHQPVLSVMLSDGTFSGRGMATGLAYRGETPDVLLAEVEANRERIEAGMTRVDLADWPIAGGTKAALDAALWELDAACAGTTVAASLGLDPQPVASAYTIVLDTPDEMAAQARAENWRPLLKVKLGGDPEREADRIEAVAQAAPQTRRVIDANAGWTPAQLGALAPVAARCGYELLEQPLPMGCEEDPDAAKALRAAADHLPLCADESFQTLADLDRVAPLYQAVNIKLDKCGGLTAALTLRDAARTRNLSIFVGCMLAPTIAVAPAHLLAQSCDYADLDGPFWFPDEPARLDADGCFRPIGNGVWGAGLTAGAD